MAWFAVEYTYFIFTCAWIPLWTFCFIAAKKVRRELLFVSGLGALTGFLLEWFVWTRDWVRPVTLTATPAGIEDILLGWCIGGIAAVLFEVWFPHARAQTARLHAADFWIIVAASCTFGLLSFFSLGLHSFFAWLISVGVPTAVILWRRPDLIRESLLTGAALIAYSIPAYLLVFWLNPGFRSSYWQWNNLSGVAPLGIPIEDLVWFFTAGAFIAPLYDYWCHRRLAARHAA